MTGPSGHIRFTAWICSIGLGFPEVAEGLHTGHGAFMSPRNVHMAKLAAHMVCVVYVGAHLFFMIVPSMCGMLAVS